MNNGFVFFQLYEKVSFEDEYSLEGSLSYLANVRINIRLWR